MKWANNVVFLIIGSIFHKSNAEEFNLNFHQDDYQLIPERVELVRYNKELLEEVYFKTFKYNRTIAVVNATLTPKVDLGNDIEGIVQAYKFMSNEYRFFPVHFGANTCKAFAANVGGVRTAFARCGNFIGCPFRKGIKYYTCNFYPDQSKLPPYIPSGQYKVDLQALRGSQEVLFISVYGTISRPIV